MTYITNKTTSSKVRIGNSTVFNVTESNDKIPIYGYNSDKYKKFLNGKKIVSGMMALRKVTIDTFLAISVENQVNNIKESTKIDLSLQITQIEKILEDLDNAQIDDTLDNSYIVFLNDTLKNLNEAMVALNDTNSTYKDIKIFFTKFPNLMKSSYTLTNTQTESLLYYKEINGFKDDIRIDVTFEGAHTDLTLKIEDILFLKKETEINVNQNDIFEVYSFIGNINYTK